jgi:CDP-glucose 4,6-dehydratase
MDGALVMFGDTFRGRRVLITGHTGFKGAWLSHWLLELGAQVTGVALAPNTEPALFNILDLEPRLNHNLLDIRDDVRLAAVMSAVQPEVILHLAAQPLVRLSYAEPRTTWETNVLGTVNVLEAVRACPAVRACVVVTSDKCYENREQLWGYRETDAMGGHDPYSASKGAAELVVASYRRSFFHRPDTAVIASARAGNVIGGGDWAQDRIVTDFVSSIRAGRSLRLRNPLATRPWQHVLEPLSGYLHLASRMLKEDGRSFADGWNFGPADASVTTVEDLAHRLVAAWGSGEVIVDIDPSRVHEAGLLKLDCSRAANRLAWHGVWDVAATVEHTVAWYQAHAEGRTDLRQLTTSQLAQYAADAQRLGQPWASP